jgi:hypothetical protein
MNATQKYHHDQLEHQIFVQFHPLEYPHEFSIGNAPDLKKPEDGE